MELVEKDVKRASSRVKVYRSRCRQWSEDTEEQIELWAGRLKTGLFKYFTVVSLSHPEVEREAADLGEFYKYALVFEVSGYQDG